MKKIILYLLILVFVIAVLILPDFLLNTENFAITFPNKKSTNSIDIEYEDIYLVKAIHDIENSAAVELSEPVNQYVIVGAPSSNDIIQNLKTEIPKLKEFNILKEMELNQELKLGLMYKEYENNKNSYSLTHVVLELDNSKNLFKIENKTKKFLYVAVETDYLASTQNKEELLKNYIKYLNLTVIDDWKYEVESENKFCMKSEKARICISLEISSTYYMFSMHIM